MSTGLVDAPVDIETIEDDIAETIGVYEPRIKINNIDFEMDEEGNAELSIDIEESDYVEDDDIGTEEAQEMALEDSADIPTTQS
jgi:predicted component of type VI protein secretion system